MEILNERVELITTARIFATAIDGVAITYRNTLTFPKNQTF
jgi:hypothetical protein